MFNICNSLCLAVQNLVFSYSTPCCMRENRSLWGEFDIFRISIVLLSKAQEDAVAAKPAHSWCFPENQHRACKKFQRTHEVGRDPCEPWKKKGEHQDMSFEPCPGDDTQKPIPLQLICQSGHHAPLRRLNCSSTTRTPDFVFDMSEEHKAGVWDLLPESWPDSGNDLRR